MSFTETEVAYLATQQLGRLATVQPDGTLQVNPVGFTYDPASEVIDIRGYNMGASRKFRNVAGDGRVAFVVDDIPSADPWRVRCLEVRAHAEAIATADSNGGLDGAMIR
jgi:pyridoxamine 5'-phosphate oxidase family protein